MIALLRQDLSVAERALNYGFTGPNLRAAGVDYDVRVAESL